MTGRIQGSNVVSSGQMVRSRWLGLIALYAFLAAVQCVMPGCVVAAPKLLSDADVVVHVEDRVEYYDVYARNTAELYARIRAIDHFNGKRIEAGGLTATELRLSSSTLHGEDGCRLTDAQIHLSVTMVLPRWRRDAFVPKGLQKVWPRLEGLITEHEQKHRQNALNAAQNLREELQQLPPTGDCRQMDRTLNREFARHQQRRAIRDQLLDRHYLLLRRGSVDMTVTRRLQPAL